MIRPSKIESAVDWADYKSGKLYVGKRELGHLIRSSDFIGAIYHSWLRKDPTRSEKAMLNAVLVSFSGGWSFFPPTVLSSRLAASTGAPISQCLAAGFCASGPSHAGAIEKSMELFLSEENPAGYVGRMVSSGRAVPGFGHPAIRRDPRPKVLRKLAKELGIEGKALRKFDRIGRDLYRAKGIRPNIDGINGAILVDLGFENPAYGTAIFLLGRMLSLTAHILEEYERPPFDIYKVILPACRQVRYSGKP